MKSRNFNILSILTIFVFGLVFLFWFDLKNGLVVIGGDGMIPLNPIANLKFLYTWVPLDHGRQGNLAGAFMYLFYAFWQKIGASLAWSQFLNTYFIHVVGGLGMYYLAQIIFNDYKKKRIAALLSAFIYMFTPATFNMSFTYSLYGFLPLMLALFADGLRKGKYIYFLLVALCFFAGGLPDPHPRPLIIALSVIFFYTIFEIFRTKKFKKIVLSFIATIFFIFLVNAWFFVPYLNDFLSPGYVSSATSRVETHVDGKFLDEGTATINRMFRLFHDGISLPTVKQTVYFSNKIIKATNYLYPILAFAAVFFICTRKKRENQQLIFFLFLALFFLFAAKGPNPPVGGLYKWLLINMPLFRIFRTTAYLILGAAFAYSILIPFTIVEISQFIKNKFLKISCFCLFFVFIIVNVYPIFFGYLTLNPGNVIPADTTKRGMKIPDDYYQLNHWLDINNLTDGKVLYLPLYRGYEALRFGYFGIPIFLMVANTPLINSADVHVFDNQSVNQSQDIIYNQIINGDYKAEVLAGLYNIKYIIVNNDVYGTEDTGINLKTKELFALVNDFGDLSLYRVDDKYLLPHFYAPNRVVLVDQNIRNFLDVISWSDDRVRLAVFFKEQNNGQENIIDQIVTQIKTPPIVEFKKINPAKYRVSVHNAGGVFPVVFSENYNQNWKLYLIRTKEAENINFFNLLNSSQGTIQNDQLPKGNFYETWLQESLGEDQHLVANGYANSWVIDSKALCQKSDFCHKNSDNTYNFDMIVEFWPQRLFYMGLLISGLTLFGGLGYSVWTGVRKIKRKKKLE